MEARITGRAGKSCVSVDTSDATIKALNLYELRAVELREPAFAIYQFAGTFTKKDNLISADLDGDGQAEFFRACTSSEGVHFTIWSGRPLEGRLRWHQYYYLGYDVEPDCTDKDVGVAPGK